MRPAGGVALVDAVRRWLVATFASPQPAASDLCGGALPVGVPELANTLVTGLDFRPPCFRRIGVEHSIEKPGKSRPHLGSIHLPPKRDGEGMDLCSSEVCRARAEKQAGDSGPNLL